MIEIITGSPAGVLEIRAVGEVTGSDYEKVLVPAVEKARREHGKIRLLYRLGPEFDGYTAAAMWDDAKLGVKNLTAFERIAVVSDVAWLAGAVRAFAFAIPCPVRVFGNGELAAAREWIAATGGE
jgi:hypothetical protein